MNVDSLPLKQTFNFSLDLNSSDHYILFNPNIFTLFHDNPFLNETRIADIDFGYKDNFVIKGIYKLPGGYKVESLPKNAIITLPDKSIRFSRLLQEDDGYLTLYYEIKIDRSIFLSAEYPDLHDFYKRMFEMLNEQIVLKKS